MKSLQMWVRSNEFFGVSGLTLPSRVSKSEVYQRGGGDAAPSHSTADACFGCVDWYSYDRLEHGRVVSSWQATVTR